MKKERRKDGEEGKGISYSLTLRSFSKTFKVSVGKSMERLDGGVSFSIKIYIRLIQWGKQ